MKYNIPKNTINDWFKDIDKYKNAIKTSKNCIIKRKIIKKNNYHIELIFFFNYLS